MKNEKLTRSIGNIGDDLLDEAASYDKSAAPGGRAPVPRRIKLRRAALIAASLALVITLGFLIPPLFRSSPAEPVSGDDPGAGTVSGTEVKPGITFNGSAYVTDAGAELPEPLKQVEILANGTAEKLIPTNTTLVVKTVSECDTETLTSYITVTPELPMAVTQVTATEFHIKPAQTQFAPNTLYRVTVGDPQNPASSFAFQTVNELAVRSILPAAGASNVPVDTGIEITFNDAVKNADFSEYITVSPKIRGSFMLYPNGKTVVFVPENDLEYNTAYTVTVKEGVESVAGKTLAEGKTAVFRTVSGETANGIGFDLRSYIKRSGSSISRALLTPGTPLDAGDVISYNYTVYKAQSRTTLNNAAVSAEIYRATSWEAAFEAAKAIYFGYFSDGPDYDALIDEYFKKAASIGDSGELTFAPEEEGFYLAVFTAKQGDNTCVKYDTFQASQLKLGGVSSSGSTVMCVCDASGEFVPGVTLDGIRFNINDVFAGRTDGVKPFKASCGEDGAVMVENGFDDALLFIYSDGERSALAFDAAALTDENENYIKFLYTDRRVYFSDDTVNVWGSLNGVFGAEVPDELYIFTGFSSVGTPVRVNRDGTFSASLTISGARQTSSFVRVEDRDGRVLAYKSISVTESEKPVLKAQMTFDKPYYLYDETITATVNVTFFDGTPAEGYDVSLNCNTFKPAKTAVTTDKNGNAAFTIKTGYTEAKSTAPKTLFVYAYISGEGTDSINLYGYTTYFHSQYVFACEGRTLKLNWLDISKCPDYVAGDPAKGSVSADLYKSVTKVTTVTEYDPYTKKKITRKRYDTTEEYVKNTRYEIDGTLELPEVKSDSEYVYYYYKVRMSERRNIYEFTVPASDGRQNYYGGGWYYNRQAAGISLDKERYGVDETVKATFQRGDTSGKDALIAFFAGGLAEYSAFDAAEIKFTEELLPLIQARALCYDTVYGSFLTYTAEAYYDYGKYAAAEMDVKTDKESYKPGDTAVITVKAPELAGGTALISIVDEACLALGENKADIINSYISSQGYYRNYGYYDYSFLYSSYGSYSYGGYYYGTQYYYNARSDIAFGSLSLSPAPNTPDGRLYVKASSRDIMDNGLEYAEEERLAQGSNEPGAYGEAEKSYYVREIFLDNPLFAVVTLNENGEGTVVCRIPDNLTTWRVTAFAVKNAEKISDIRISQSESDTVCTIPFFVKADVCGKYVTGDDIALSVHCFGAKAEGTANYTAVIADPAGNEIARKEVSGSVTAFTGINFGKLEEGDYTVTVYADCGEHTDAVKTGFSVVNTMLAVNICKTVTAEELAAIKPLAYPVSVVIRGGDSDTLYTQILHRLYYAGRYDDPRADALAAKYAAVSIMQKIYGYDAGKDDVSELFGKYISNGQGVKLLTYGEPDIELTALIADTAKELLGAGSNVLKAFEDKIDRNEFANDEELCAVLYGMAALGEPVLDTLYAAASYAGDFDDIAKLYLACGFAAAGDYGAALEIYSAVAQKCSADKGDGKAMYLDTGDSETTVKATSLALIAASRIKRADAQKLASYLASVPNRNGGSAELALAAFVKYYIPAGEQQFRTVAYTLADGERKEAEIGFGKTLSLTLYKADFESLKLEGCENASISVRYSGSAAETGAYSGDDGRVHIEKTIDGDHVILRVYGTSTRRWECFEINDVIPSGARYLFTDRSSWERGVNGSAYIYNRAGQQITGHVYVDAPESITRKNEKDNYEFCDEYSFSVTVRYRIRKAVKGEFAVEPAVVRSEYTGVYSISESGTLVYD